MARRGASRSRHRPRPASRTRTTGYAKPCRSGARYRRRATTLGSAEGIGRPCSFTRRAGHGDAAAGFDATVRRKPWESFQGWSRHQPSPARPRSPPSPPPLLGNSRCCWNRRWFAPPCSSCSRSVRTDAASPTPGSSPAARSHRSGMAARAFKSSPWMHALVTSGAQSRRKWFSFAGSPTQRPRPALSAIDGSEVENTLPPKAMPDWEQTLPRLARSSADAEMPSTQRDCQLDCRSPC